MAGAIHQEMSEQGYGASGGPLLLAGAPCSTGYIEMRPVVLFREASQKAGRRDRACRAATNVAPETRKKKYYIRSFYLSTVSTRAFQKVIWMD